MIKLIFEVALLSLFTGFASAASLQRGEWFLDSDQGVGSGTAFVAKPETSVTIPADVVDSLPPGIHLLGVRFLDDEGFWGHTVWKSFVREEGPDTPATLASGEWFLDEDPGVGLGRAFEIASNSFSIALNQPDLEALESGNHLLGVRLKDRHGRWGFTVWRTFHKDELANEMPPISSLEYRLVRDGVVVGVGAKEVSPPSSMVELLLTHGKDGLQLGSIHSLQVLPVDASGRKGHAVYRNFDYRRYAEAWRMIHFTESERGDPELSGDPADPDGDGLTNGEERAFALNPRDASDAASAVPRIASNDEELLLSFRVPGGGSLSPTGVYETSDLSWRLLQGDSPAASGNLPAAWLRDWELESASDGSARLKVRLSPSGTPRRFFRLETRR